MEVDSERCGEMLVAPVGIICCGLGTAKDDIPVG